MDKILFIGNDKKYNIKFSLDLLKKKNYDIVIVNTINNLNKNLKYHYKIIIIDIEFDNRNGDNICKNLRYNFRKVPIIGIYSYYDRNSTNKKYNLSKFNNVVSLPIINWDEVFQECYLPCTWNKKKWDEWMSKELNLCTLKMPT